MMPPAGLPRPADAVMKGFAALLEASIDAQAALHPNAGRPALHRLNRTEYANSIHDLLDLNIDAAALLPVDDMSHGFDNMADVLTMSPALMDRYIRAAGKISRQALGDPHASPAMITYRIPRVISQMRHVEGTPFGTRGGMSVVHNFPADGEYTFKMIFYASLDGPLFGRNQGKGQQIEISINGARVALLDVDPNLKSTDDLRTPAIKIKSGPQRVAAAFIQKFDGPLEDDVMPIELSLVDLNNARVSWRNVAAAFERLQHQWVRSRRRAFPKRQAARRFSSAVQRRVRTSFLAPRKSLLSWLARLFGGQ